MPLRFFLAFVCLMAWPGLCPAQNTVKLDLNCNYPAESIPTQGAQTFARLAKDYSNATVAITVRPGGEMGFQGPEALQAVKDSVLPMSDMLMGLAAKVDPVFLVSSLPLVSRSYAEARAQFDTLKPRYDAACEKHGQRLLYAAPWPPSGLFAAGAIENIHDFKTLKVRAYDDNGGRFLKDCGAQAVDLPWRDVGPALQQGRINAVLTSAVSGLHGGFWKKCKVFNAIDFAYPLSMVTINQDYWNGLAPDQREALSKAASETETIQWAASQAEHEKALQGLEAKGVRIVRPTPELELSLGQAAMQTLLQVKQGAGPELQQALQAIGK